jgi:hypothetical protein
LDKKKKKRKNLQKKPISTIVEKEVKATFELLIYATPSGRESFNDWLDSLDGSVRGKVEARIDRLAQGQFGNAKAQNDDIAKAKERLDDYRSRYGSKKT